MKLLKKLLTLIAFLLIGLIIIAAYLRVVPNNLPGAVAIALCFAGFIFIILPLPHRIDTGKWPWQMDWNELKIFLSRFRIG
jgi:hypothetical protein